MTPVWWMIGTSVVSWLLATMLVPGAVNPEVGLGMLGPLASAVVSWLVTLRTYRLAPERTLAVMTMALVGKMLFFAAYVVVMVRGLELRPMPFVASFTVYFVGLYAMQAIYLKRLFQGDAQSSRA